MTLWVEAPATVGGFDLAVGGQAGVLDLDPRDLVSAATSRATAGSRPERGAHNRASPGWCAAFPVGSGTRSCGNTRMGDRIVPVPADRWAVGILFYALEKAMDSEAVPNPLRGLLDGDPVVAGKDLDPVLVGRGPLSQNLLGDGPHAVHVPEEVDEVLRPGQERSSPSLPSDLRISLSDFRPVQSRATWCTTGSGSSTGWPFWLLTSGANYFSGRVNTLGCAKRSTAWGSPPARPGPQRWSGRRERLSIQTFP